MPDLVGTCPMDFWQEWIDEGDAAGLPESGEEWGWWTRHRLAATINPGERFYVVAHGMLRGYAPVTRVLRHPATWVVCRKGGAVACTIARPIPGFRGLEERWWPRDEEIEFPDWKTAGLIAKQTRAAKPTQQADMWDVMASAATDKVDA